MRPEEFDALLEAGIVGEPVEFIGGRWVMGRYEFHFSPEMAADAAKLGITLPTCATASEPDGEAASA